MTKRVYECDITKKKDLMKVLEADPYAKDSFAKAGYKTKEGAMIGEDKAKLYVYISAEDAFLKKAEEKLKGIVEHSKDEVGKRIIALIEKEEESATSGFGDIFG
ncbi:Uncharacterised protein [uncultured archaeon]|nr:Uncharacterised protein [uncultured archaeon]